MRLSLVLLLALFGLLACTMGAPEPKAMAAPGGGRNYGSSSSSSGGRGGKGSSSSSSGGRGGKGGSSSSSGSGGLRGFFSGGKRGGKRSRRGGKIIKKKALFHTTYTHVPQYITVDKYVKIPVPIPVPIPVRGHGGSSGSGGGSIITGRK